MFWRRGSIATECGRADHSGSSQVEGSNVLRSMQWRRLARAGVAVLFALTGSRALAVDVDETPDIIKITTLRESALAYETGDGMPQDMPRAIALYCEAARYGDAKSQFDLGLMYAYGRGVDRSDRMASFFLQAAAGQGVEQAQNMLKLMGEPTGSIPDCMRDPVAAKNNFVNPPKAIAKYEVPLLAPGSIVALVKQIAPQYSVPAPLVFAIMEAESNFNSVAISPRNAQGLMQLMPDTAARFRVRNAFDPAQNVRGGVAYLRWLLAYFEGDVALVAAAYNAGERAVERYRGVPPFLETRAYVRRIVAAVGPVADSYDNTVVEPSAYMRQIRDRQR
jgi:hypothetical protein